MAVRYPHFINLFLGLLNCRELWEFFGYRVATLEVWISHRLANKEPKDNCRYKEIQISLRKKIPWQVDMSHKEVGSNPGAGKRVSREISFKEFLYGQIAERWVHCST